MLRRGLLIVFLILGAATCALAQAGTQVNKEKEQNIRRLLDIIGATKVGAQVMEQELATVRTEMQKTDPAIAKQVVDIMQEELRKDFTPERITELLIPIYDRHLTNEDIVGLIAFYQSEVGKKTITVLPQVVKESYDSGVELGRAVQKRVIDRIRAEVKMPAPARKSTKGRRP
ncbi:MAG TPA: DUF2059 domain-containing protein [Pyrinomonadaceae bacterium]|nr:DUF2059 domain-containing protein [Pyrinomonadaceae bacterium]